MGFLPFTAMPASSRPLEERFWEKVHKNTEITSPHVDTPCWVWTAYTNRGGYGTIRDGENMRLANRISWELHYGTIPDDKFVCHKCDRPACVAPLHLFLDDQQGNMTDMVLKGRHARLGGEEHGMARITEKDVLEIRRRYAAGEIVVNKMAKEYDLDSGTISRIVCGKLWPHVPNAIPLVVRNRGSKITAEKVLEIRSKFSNGSATEKELAADVGFSIAGIRLIIRGRTWKNLLPKTQDADKFKLV